MAGLYLQESQCITNNEVVKLPRKGVLVQVSGVWYIFLLFPQRCLQTDTSQFFLIAMHRQVTTSSKGVEGEDYASRNLLFLELFAIFKDPKEGEGKQYIVQSPTGRRWKTTHKQKNWFYVRLYSQCPLFYLEKAEQTTHTGTGRRGGRQYVSLWVSTWGLRSQVKIFYSCYSCGSP